MVKCIQLQCKSTFSSLDVSVLSMAYLNFLRLLHRAALAMAAKQQLSNCKNTNSRQSFSAELNVSGFSLNTFNVLKTVDDIIPKFSF